VKRALAAKTTVITAILLPLVVAGCSGGGAGSSASSSAPSARTSSGPPFPKAAAQAAAQQALLTISDFPAGWSTSKDDSADDNSDKRFDQQLADCLHAPAGLLHSGGAQSADADSPDFDSPDGDTTISESVSVAQSDRVDQLFTVLKQDNATDCISTTVNAYLKDQLAKTDDPDVKDATIGHVEVGQLSAGHYGDDTVAMRATLPVSAKGLTLKVYLDLLFIRHANSSAFLTFVNEGTPVDPATTDKYAQLATDKLTRTTIPTA
jgi:hypothetical protein